MYDAGILFLVMLQKWESWIAFVLGISLALGWILHIGAYRDYRFRAIMNTLAMQVCLLLYMSQVGELTSVIGIFASSVVFIGLYGILDLLCITWASSVLLILYHVFIAHSIQITSLEEGASLALQIGNIFVLQYVVYMWAKRWEQTKEYAQNVRNASEMLIQAENVIHISMAANAGKSYGVAVIRMR